MSSLLKRIILGVVLMLPVLIFLFLKGFGENVYQVEIFYQTDKPDSIKVCNASIPHKADLSEIQFDLGEHDFHLFVLEKAFGFPEKTKNHVFQRSAVEAQYRDMWECQFVVDIDTVSKGFAVLVDTMRYIRGYYDLLEREELDRLKTELTIIKREYAEYK